jgi:signal transduction histidine kinase
MTGSAARRRRVVRGPKGAVFRFAAAGLVAVVVIGLGVVAVLQRVGVNEAISDAKQVSRLAGEGIVAPQLTRGVLAGRSLDLERLDDVVRARVLPSGIVRVKVWSAAGRVVYSDEPRLVGAAYPLGADDRAALATGRVDAELSDLTRPENRFERGRGKLLEVYLPVRGEGGQRLLFEVYLPYKSISASGRRLWLAFAPALLGGLLLLQLVNLPLARSLVSRVREGQDERERLLRRAVESSALERRRIAADLHDGPVQHLTGVSYGLAAAAERVDGSSPQVIALLQRGAAATRNAIRELRTLLVEIHPPTLHQTGLAAAVADLAATLGGRGVDVEVDVEEPGELDESTEALLFRCAQEAVRNVVSHADAPHAWVRLSKDGDRVRLEVRDDGNGFAMDDRPEPGHVGLRLLTALVADSGGELQVESAPGRGTSFVAEMPAP